MARFTAEFIRRIAEAPVYDVISPHVELKRAGTEFKAKCPFGDEKTPSFHVVPAKNFFHCFHCGRHGNAITWAMEYHGLQFIDAVKEVAKQLGIAITDADYETTPQKGHRQNVGNVLEVLESVHERYEATLLATKEGAEAITYLKERGITPEIAARFRVGFAPGHGVGLVDGKRPLTKADQTAAVSAGILKQQDQRKPYERFRSRLMFPIRNLRGEIVGHTGRLLGAASGNAPKYLNTPETEVFQKRNLLYGAYETSREFRRCNELFVLEGPVDVQALHAAGLPAVCSMGTAFTGQHLRQCVSMARTVIFAFDGDRAGREAAWKAATQVAQYISGDMEFRFVVLPDPHDPGSLLQSFGPERVREEMAKSTTFSSFVFAHLERTAPANGPERKAAIATGASALASQMQDGVFRDAFLLEVRERCGVDISARVGCLRAQDAVGSGQAAYARVLMSLYPHCQDAFVDRVDALASLSPESDDAALLKWVVDHVAHARNTGATLPSPSQLVDWAFSECQDGAQLAGLFLAKGLGECAFQDPAVCRGLVEQATRSLVGDPGQVAVDAQPAPVAADAGVSEQRVTPMPVPAPARLRRAAS